jgi:nucleotide-binding universal stress UspA family protein
VNILCATDLSETSPAVIQTAAVLSKLLGADLELFHALLMPATSPPELVDELLVTGLHASAQTSLGKQAAAARAAGAKVTTRLQIGGADAILDRASQTQPDLLVVGTHARRGVSRALLGSVAERTLRKSPCPVLVVPPTVSTSALSRNDAPARLRVVAGIDFSPASDAALTWLASLRRRVECDIRLVHLYLPVNEHARLGLPPPIPFEVNAELVDVLGRELRSRVQAATGTDFPLRIRPVWGGEDDPLAWEAETDDADLLIIGTSQARRSTALRTVRGAHLPVLCVPRNETVPATKPLAPVKTILVPTDFSPAARTAVLEAYRLLLGAGGDLILAHVAKPDGVGLEPDRQEEIETCLLALVPADLQAPHIRVRTLVMTDTAPGEAIVKAVRRVGADLVVMAARGRSGRPGAHGMVTEHVVWNATQPVVVVPSSPEP